MTLLEQSLCMMSGMSPEAECRLRRLGILTCRQLACEAGRVMSKSHAIRVRSAFAEWEMARDNGLIDWMVNHLPVGHRVRALKDYWSDAVFYDIETDGTAAASCITCISTLRNGEMRTFWRGRNLPEFLSEWAKAKILVSFNGKRFDTPIVCKAFGLTSIPAQIDLMDEAAHYGYRGGLKAVEKRVGFMRNVAGCRDGRDAVRLWSEYEQTKSEDILKVLQGYNQDDVLSLEFLAKRLLRWSLENTQMENDSG